MMRGGACSKAQAELPVYVVGQPVVQIQGPKQVCVHQEVGYALAEHKDQVAQQVNWDFGKGLKGQGRAVKVQFTQAGTREIHTVVDGQPGPALTVQVRSLPKFALPEQRTVLVGEELLITPLQLDDTGLQPVFRWESGDGTALQGPVFRQSYNKPGTYIVRLGLSGGPEEPACLTAEKEIAVTVLPLPAARILHQPEQIFSGGARDEVLFRAEVSTEQGSWLHRWDFGDGTRAEGSAVSHVFEKPGTYTVTLTLIDGSGITRQPYRFSRKITVRGR
ncbi:MAG: PKD domain-containing protein [Candidatus Electrothrix sp. ATG2]|nr:PKD domain-containing protein [Candidatus Electrothrix sp. ATG2]